MIEVFKTNVKELSQASVLLDHIHTLSEDVEANFDLEDCDNILRIKSHSGRIQPLQFIRLLNDFGYNAEVLPD
ncbi:MAG: hypothetical protein ABI683_05560 [Ginsengibacter sp.]